MAMLPAKVLLNVLVVCGLFFSAPLFSADRPLRHMFESMAESLPGTGSATAAQIRDEFVRDMGGHWVMDTDRTIESVRKWKDPDEIGGRARFEHQSLTITPDLICIDRDPERTFTYRVILSPLADQGVRRYVVFPKIPLGRFSRPERAFEMEGKKLVYRGFAFDRFYDRSDEPVGELKATEPDPGFVEWKKQSTKRFHDRAVGYWVIDEKLTLDSFLKFKKKFDPNLTLDALRGTFADNSVDITKETICYDGDAERTYPYDVEVSPPDVMTIAEQIGRGRWGQRSSKWVFESGRLVNDLQMFKKYYKRTPKIREYKTKR